MKKGFGLILMGMYVLSTVFFCGNLQEGGEMGFGGKKLTAADFGVMCISTSYPGFSMDMADSRDNDKSSPEDYDGSSTGDVEIKALDAEEKPEPVIFGDDPAVLIVHTHATDDNSDDRRQ